jgi:hypothetical protein
METEHIYGAAIAMGAVACLVALMRSRGAARARDRERERIQKKRFYDELYDPKNRIPPSSGE